LPQALLELVRRPLARRRRRSQLADALASIGQGTRPALQFEGGLRVASMLLIAGADTIWRISDPTGCGSSSNWTNDSGVDKIAK
jgi:hypothetical protein